GDDSAVLRGVVDDDRVADRRIARLEAHDAVADDRGHRRLKPAVRGEIEISRADGLRAGAVEDRDVNLVREARLIEAADVRARIRIDSDSSRERARARAGEFEHGNGRPVM